MIKIENVEVHGWEPAIRGMRNPKNSWERSDSVFHEEATTTSLDNGLIRKQFVQYDALSIGENDHTLMMNLANGGPVHAKYRRMITVYVDITAPLYWWKEFETYRTGVTPNPMDIEMNSCSTMHKIHEKEFTIDDFSCEHLISSLSAGDEREFPIIDVSPFRDRTVTFTPSGVLECLIIPMLNTCRDKYLETKDKKYWWQMIQLLPSSYNQKRTVMLNYEVLAGIYEWRKNHKLDEWRELCKWIETLPYSEIITGEKEGDEK